MVATPGQTIVSLRKQKNWRRQHLAERIGVTTRQLIRWENDQVQLSPKSVSKIILREMVTCFQISRYAAKNHSQIAS